VAELSVAIEGQRRGDDDQRQPGRSDPPPAESNRDRGREDGQRQRSCEAPPTRRARVPGELPPRVGRERIDRPEQREHVVGRNHRRQRCSPARAPDAARDCGDGRESERPPKRRVAHVEPANPIAVDRHFPPREQASLGSDPVAFRTQEETPVNEQ
jgi:hypothetical protein